MSLIHKLEGQVAVNIYSFEDMEGKAADGILKDETGRPGLWRGRVVCDGVGVCGQTGKAAGAAGPRWHRRRGSASPLRVSSTSRSSR